MSWKLSGRLFGTWPGAFGGRRVVRVNSGGQISFIDWRGIAAL